MKKIIIVLIVILVLITGWIYFVKSRLVQEWPLTPLPQACTEEVKICPDGSAVGRTGSKCEFAACPSEALPLR